MDSARFLHTLHVDPTDAAAEPDQPSLADALRAMDTAVRLDRPEELPRLDLQSAEWATRRLHAICLALQQEHENGAHLEEQAECPGSAEDPATHFSVDLALRHLRVVFARASTLADDDQQRLALLRLAHDWPLSSVGMSEVTEVNAAVILSHDGLRRTYVERILRLRDEHRRRDEDTQRAVAAVMAEHMVFATEVLAVHDAIIQPRQE